MQRWVFALRVYCIETSLHGESVSLRYRHINHQQLLRVHHLVEESLHLQHVERTQSS